MRPRLERIARPLAIPVRPQLAALAEGHSADAGGDFGLADGMMAVHAPPPTRARAARNRAMSFSAISSPTGSRPCLRCHIT